MDIRFKELELLANIDRIGRFTVGPLNGWERDLAAFLVWRGYVNDLNVSWIHNERMSTALPGESELERRMHSERVVTLSKIIGGRDAALQITHAGRVRMAELRQILRSAKLREQNDILWDGRHFNIDLRIALLDASHSTPVSVAYLDLNGFKNVNDTMGHDAGDIVIRAYFHNVTGSLTDRGDAYRLGGDEVGVIIPACPMKDGIEIIRRACLLLQPERLQFDGEELPPVSIAAGITVSETATDSGHELRKAAEMSMYKAKKFTKERSSRRSSFNVAGEDAVHLVKSNAPLNSK